MNLQQKLDEERMNPKTRDNNNNPQILWHNFKSEIKKKMENEEKKPHYKCLKKLRDLTKDRKETLK